MNKLLFFLSTLLLICSPVKANYFETTELFDIQADNTVSSNMFKTCVDAAKVWGLLVDRTFVQGPKGYIYLSARSGMGWTIAETIVSGPGWNPSNKPHLIMSPRGIITINSDNWNPLLDVFVYDNITATLIMVHEIGHVLGITYWGIYNSSVYPVDNLANDVGWWGSKALIEYKKEYDADALYVPLYGDKWHFSENSMPYDIMSPVLQAVNGYYPEYISLTTIGILEDLGCVKNPDFVKKTLVVDLIGKRRLPRPVTIP